MGYERSHFRLWYRALKDDGGSDFGVLRQVFFLVRCRGGLT
jgi:hypothetical protein